MTSPTPCRRNRRLPCARACPGRAAPRASRARRNGCAFDRGCDRCAGAFCRCRRVRLPLGAGASSRCCCCCSVRLPRRQLRRRPPLGIWATEENKGNVRIEECGTNLCGYAVKGGEKI